MKFKKYKCRVKYWYDGHNKSVTINWFKSYFKADKCVCVCTHACARTHREREREREREIRTERKVDSKDKMKQTQCIMCVVSKMINRNPVWLKTQLTKNTLIIIMMPIQCSAHQVVGRYHSILSCALNIVYLILNNNL